MPSAAQRLDVLSVSLRQALSRQDWETITRLDRECRMVLDVLGGESMLREQLEALSLLYTELLRCGQVEKARLAAELVQLTQSKQGAKAYQALS